jgi:hypothetical protein
MILPELEDRKFRSLNDQSAGARFDGFAQADSRAAISVALHLSVIPPSFVILSEAKDLRAAILHRDSHPDASLPADSSLRTLRSEPQEGRSGPP